MKGKKDKLFHIRMSEEDIKKIDLLAFLYQESRSEIIRKLVKKDVERMFGNKEEPK